MFTFRTTEILRFAQDDGAKHHVLSTRIGLIVRRGQDRSMAKYGFVYILTNKSGSTLYIGVTSDVVARLNQHRTGEGGSGFAKRYRLNRLIYFEAYSDIRQAIAREKQLKGWKRSRKDELIRAANPKLADLSEEASRVFTELRLGSGIVR